MIAGIGIDMVSVSRMAEKIQSEAFKDKIFSSAEKEYCDKNSNKEQHYAVRFAAKEAFLKATGKGLMAGYDLNDIETTVDEVGKPSMNLRGGFHELKKQNGWLAIHVSLSHEADNAIAIVIIEK